MDDILTELFRELNHRINEFRSKNKDIDIDDITRSCTMIECYLDGFIKEEPAEIVPETCDAMSLEDMGAISRSLFTIPPGHVGPSSEMVNYVIKKDKNLQKRISRLAKDLENSKNKPYFPTLTDAPDHKKMRSKN